MANARALVKRLKAVKSIRKITRTMELIATARFKQAMDRASEAAAYTQKLNEIVADLASSGSEISHPLLAKPAETKKTATLILTSNRGFCGGYNGGILRKAVKHFQAGRDAGESVDVEVSGKKGISFMKFERHDIDRSFTNFEDKPAFDEVDELASRYAKDFMTGKLHRLDVAWMKFESASRQSVAIETLLPFGDLSTGDAGESKAAVDYDFLPSAEDILEELVPAAFKARLFKCFLDAAVSEQIARRVAMKAATENADEMTRDLSQEYNRARQSQITSELAEIIGGAAALE